MEDKSIAIVSTNLEEYTETFIHNHVRLLPGNIHLLYDGYLPKRYNEVRVNAAGPILPYSARNWFSMKAKSEKHYRERLNSAIENYLSENRIQLIIAEYGPSGVEMMPFSKKLKIPLVVHFHGFDAYRKDVLEEYGEKYADLFNMAKAIIVVSKHMHSQIKGMGCDPSKLYYLPYGIDTSLFIRSDPANYEIEFVSCGRFVEKKAPHLTIRAFAKVLKEVPTAKLVMIGEGKLKTKCVELAQELGIVGSITFPGKLTQQQIAIVYRRALVFVQHSVVSQDGDSEGTPLAILESAACGLPAVSTRHGGIVDVVAEGKTGYLVDEGDVDSMAEKMLHLIQHPELAKKMGANASTLIQQRYSIEMYTGRLIQIVDTLLKNT